jgi:A/G-specific adenine glycosylase
MNVKLPRFQTRLIQWYLDNQKPYPWRQNTDPYRIWLSEVLLQQTRISVVLRYYEEILKRFPDVNSLAAADDQEFLSLWSGVGYYQRGKNMLRCARDIMNIHGGRFPEDVAVLKTLPGIGSYTAGALRNICFSKLTAAIDGNIARVLARVTGNSRPSHTKLFRQDIEAAFLKYGRGANTALYFQGLMELGERICLQVPQCSSCPVHRACVAAHSGIAAELPLKRPSVKTQNYHWFFLLLRRSTSAYYVRNSHRSFLKDAWLFPDVLVKQKLTMKQAENRFANDWKIQVQGLNELKTIRHSVTFRRIAVHVLSAANFHIEDSSGLWLTPSELCAYPTSSVISKILEHSL